MTLQAFNLMSQLRTYNQREKKNIPLDTSFELLVFDPKMTQVFIDAIALMSDCHLIFSGVKNVASVPGIKDELKDNILRNQFSQVKEALAKIRGDNQLAKAHQWYCDQQKRLSESRAWEGFIQAAEGANQQEIIRVSWLNWQQHQAYSHYTSEAIGFMASKVMLIIEKYHQLAIREISYRRHRNKMPPAILKAFQAYLKELNDNLQSTRHAICASMLARLQVAAATKDLAYDDVTLHMADKLVTLKVIKCENGFLQSPRRGLTCELMVEFHDYILRTGSDKQKEGLLQLPWFREDEKFTTVNTKKAYLVPRSIQESSLLPRYIFSSWLFQRRHFRQKFIESRLGLLIRVRLFSKVNVNSFKLSADRIENYFSDLEKLWKDLEISDETCLKWQAKGLWGLIHRTTNRFIRLWLDFSTEERVALIHHKVSMLSAIRRRFDLAKYQSMPPQQFITKNFAACLQKEITNLNQQITAFDISETVKEKFNQDKRLLLQRLNGFFLTDKPKAVEPEAENQKNNHPVTAPVVQDDSESVPPFIEVETPSQVVAPVSELSPSRDCRFFSSHAPESGRQVSQNTARVIDNAVSSDLMRASDADFYQARAAVSQAACDIERGGQLPSDHAIYQAIEHLFLSYLRCAKNIQSTRDFEPLSARFVAMESLLTQYFIPEPIRYRVEQLRLLRHQAQWQLTFSIQAESYLTSYDINAVKTPVGGLS